MGWAASANVHLGMVATEQMEPAANSIHASLFSRPGSFHTEIKVGIDPKHIITRLVIRPSNGLLNSISPMPTTPPIRQNLSVPVHSVIPYLMTKKIAMDAPISTATIWALSAPSMYIPKATTTSKPVQISHEALLGSVFPGAPFGIFLSRKIAQM